jgi:transcriptional regulator with XRE-family HTH domain
MELAQRIRQIREAYNLTQAKIAFKCGISPSAYGQIERKASNCSYKTLEKVANSIGVSVKFLIDIGNPAFVEKNNI